MQVNSDISLSGTAVVFVSLSLQFERMSLIVAEHANIHISHAERKSRTRELLVRRDFQAGSVCVSHPEPFHSCLGTGLLRTDITVVILVLHPLAITSDKG